MTERDQGGRPEDHHRREHESVPYRRAARFRGEKPAGRAYERAQRAVFTGPPNDLSVYRLLVNQVWHVTALGEVPPPERARRIERIMAAGEPTTLPPDVLRVLAERRRQATRIAPWVKRHHRPGERI